jgi:hypothetical protein
MQTSVNILMEVDSVEADGNQWESSIMGVDAAARTHIPAMQDISNDVAISRRFNLQSDPKSDFGKVQTRKATPEALALFPFQQDPITNKRETYPLQNQTAAVAPEALTIFSDRMVPMRTYAGQRRAKEHNQEVAPEIIRHRNRNIQLTAETPTVPQGAVDSNHSCYKFENWKTVWGNSPEAIKERSIYRHYGGNINGLKPFDEHPDLISGQKKMRRLQAGG